MIIRLNTLRLPIGARTRGLLILLILPYALYLYFLLSTGTAPVDYETFMRLGRLLVSGGAVYGENSYYPLPSVMVFSAFSTLPRPVSVLLWLGLPVFAALIVARFRPYILFFAPVFAHFAGGQSSIFGLLGFWGYRRNLDETRLAGGAWLALTLLKPQLGMIPIGFALHRWIQWASAHRRLPRQFWGFAGTAAAIYLPSLIMRPGWPFEWLRSPRPVFERALSGLIPRLLLLAFPASSPSYWLLWGLGAGGLLALVWRFRGRGYPLDLLVLWGFVVSPFVHDYDLIQLAPLITGPLLEWAAVLLSLPGWWTILFQYSNDAAWVTMTIIAPGLLVVYLISHNTDLPDRLARWASWRGRGQESLARPEA